MLMVLLVLVIAGCRRRDVRLRADAVTDRAAMAVLEASDVTTIISDSGVVRYRIKAQTWKVYDKADTPYWEFPDGIYLENDELSFDVGNHVLYDEDKLPNNPTERMSIAEVVELAERYEVADDDLFMVLEHYIDLLNRYDQENAYIEK